MNDHAVFYDDVLNFYKKHRNEHLIQAKKIENGVQIGNTRITRADDGYNITDSAGNTLHSGITHYRCALLIPVLQHKDKDDLVSEVIIMDGKYRKLKNKIIMTYERIKEHNMHERWDMAEICGGRMIEYRRGMKDVENEINGMYTGYVLMR